MSSTIDTWVEQILAGDIRAISRAITAIENHRPETEEILRRVFPHTGKGYLAGITGAPGTGKSTLVDRLASHYRRGRKRGGIFAGGSTRPLSGGGGFGGPIPMRGDARRNPGFFPPMGRAR